LSSRSRIISFVTWHTTGVRMGPSGDATHERDSLSSRDCGCSLRCLFVGRDDIRGRKEFTQKLQIQRLSNVGLSGLQPSVSCSRNSSRSLAQTRLFRQCEEARRNAQKNGKGMERWIRMNRANFCAMNGFFPFFYPSGCLRVFLRAVETTMPERIYSARADAKKSPPAPFKTIESKDRDLRPCVLVRESQCL
jgi:hypothetical protein